MLERILAVPVLLVSIVFAEIALASEPILLAQGRETTSLNGDWNYIVDPQDVGGTNIMGHETSRGFFVDRTVDHSNTLLEYNFAAAPSLQTPGSWNTQDPQLYFYEGVVWLRKKFEVDVDNQKRYFVNFGAVNHRARVYLNGEFLAAHQGGFTPFTVEVTNSLKSGRNSLVVRADNRHDSRSLPAERFDWWNYGGITREVHLVETPGNFIRNFRIQLDPNNLRKAVGWVDVDPKLPNQVVRVALEGGETVSATTDTSGRATFELAAPGRLWSPDDPVLHEVTVSLGDDSMSDLIGFRTISTSGDRILLNGTEVFLRGICLHEERLDGKDRAATEEDARNLLQKVKELNANFARLAHYPHNRHMARVADEMGILLWEEIAVYWAVNFEDPEVVRQAKQDLSDLIARDGNRASVIIWSVANETPETDVRNAFLGELARHVRESDNTRLVSAATITTRESLSNYTKFVAATLQGNLADLTQEELEIEIDDPAAVHFDLLAYNQYAGWYDPVLLADSLGVTETDIRRAAIQLVPHLRFRSNSGMPLVFSELGAGALRGLRGDSLDVWSEDFQAEVLRAQMKMVENSPGVSGVSPWVLKDFRSPRRPLHGVQDYYNRKGIVDETGQHKMAFDVVREFYGEISKR